MQNLSRALTSIGLCLVIAIWIVLAGTRFASAQADSGTYEANTGPYHVAVDVLPERPIVGDLQFHVRPTLAATGAPVADARVWVILGRRGIQEIKTPALRSPTERTTYVGNAKISRPGTWTVVVEVSAAEGSAEATFEIEVASRGRSGEGLVAPTMVYAGAAVVILAGIGWLIIQSRRARRRQSPDS